MMRYFFILIFTCAGLSSHAQVNIITTIAGKDSAGFSGDGGEATLAKLKAPYRVSVDKFGNVYVVDALNQRIRKIDAMTGTISTVAGNGTAGYFGDGGQATDAKLLVPQGCVIDSIGDLYIADGLNHRIRKIIASTGVISTIVGNGTAGSGGDGGPATNAELNGPVGLHLNKSGKLYIADYYNHKVRKVDLSTGIITTIAGVGISGYSGDGGYATSAKMDGPEQVFEDNNGNILIADQWNSAVRKIQVTNGIISTIAGNGFAGYSGDGGQASDAQLNQPTGLFIDKQNNIFIAEYGNGVIRRIDGVSSKISTVAGIGTTGFSGDGGPATSAKLFCSDIFVDSYGNLIIADYENDRIRKVNNAVAVNGISKEVESKLHPNPTKGIFTIQTTIGISLVNIYNIAGIQVYERTCTTTETEIDITSQPSGVYMVYVQCGDKQYVSKIIIN